MGNDIQFKIMLAKYGLSVLDKILQEFCEPVLDALLHRAAKEIVTKIESK